MLGRRGNSVCDLDHIPNEKSDNPKTVKATADQGFLFCCALSACSLKRLCSSLQTIENARTRPKAGADFTVPLEIARGAHFKLDQDAPVTAITHVGRPTESTESSAWCDTRISSIGDCK